MADIRPASGFAWSRSVLLGQLWLIREQVRTLQLHLRRDPARDPVLDALNTAVLGKTEKFSDPCRAAEVCDAFLICAHAAH